MARDKIRILHIIPNFSSGGAERLLVDLLGSFDQDRFDVAAVSLYPEAGTLLDREIKNRRLKAYYLNKHRGFDLKIIPQLYRLFKVFRPHVVHTHLSVLRYSIFPAISCHIPIRLHTVHNVASKEVDCIGRLLHRVAFRLYRFIPVSISYEVAATVHSLYGRNIRTPVIYNGIPTRKFSAISSQRGRNRDVILIHVGRFSPQKNHKLLIEAFSLATKEYSDMHLWLVGDGKLRPEIEKLVIEKGLNNRVVFLGQSEDVPELIGKCDIFTLSSDWEGVPLTILEAMAAGKPIVATSVGGVPELVEDGTNGFLVPPRNTKILAQELLRLAKNPSLCQCLGQAGQKKVIERFDITRTAKEYEVLYLTLLKESRLT